MTVGGNSVKSNNSLNSDKVEKREESIGELVANLAVMESKLVEVQKALQSNNDDLKVFIVAEI